MKKIVILVDQMHSHGGIEKLVALKANYWATQFGYSITILATEQENRPLLYPLDKEVQFVDLGIDYNRKKSYFSFQNLRKFLSNIFRVRKYIKATQPDFVLVASHIPITYFIPFIKGNATAIKEFHFTKYYRSRQKGIKARVLTFIEGLYDYLAVLSPEEQKFYPVSKAIVLPNPKEREAVVNFEKTKFHQRFLFVGRLAPVKQIEHLLQIWDQFSPQHQGWELHIFGSGDSQYVDHLHGLHAQMNCNSTCFFRGDSNAIGQELQKADALLMTSAQECFPMVILEAHSNGVPVISYDAPTGPRNLIQHNRNGMLVELNNIDSFVHMMQTFVSAAHQIKEWSIHAQNNANQYAVEAMMERWRALIFEK